MGNFDRTNRGTKAWQLSKKGPCSKCGEYPDRAATYREWRIETDWDDNFVVDIDQIEWAPGPNGEIWPVAMLELTRIGPDDKYPGDPSRTYLELILYGKEQGRSCGQTRMQIKLAQTLGLPLYLVAFMHDLTGFWVYDLIERRGFNRKLLQQEYVDWLRSLRQKVKPGLCVLEKMGSDPMVL